MRQSPQESTKHERHYMSFGGHQLFLLSWIIILHYTKFKSDNRYIWIKPHYKVSEDYHTKISHGKKNIHYYEYL